MKHLVIFCCLIFFAITSFGQKALHLYGGSNNDVYLGCLNCNSLNSNSIWNSLGTYGSYLNSNSIWNDLGTYGGELSMYSPFNSLSNNPPSIKDDDGNFYGYLTTNTLKNNRAEFKLALTICKYWKEIKNDVSEWYSKIFN